MSVIVVGAGRSGTNVVLEILRGSDKLKASDVIEDKQVFKRYPYRYPTKYLTKCDIQYFDYWEMKRTLEHDKGIKIIFCIRDPRDMYLSKAYRGRPVSEGGDCVGYPDEGTPEGYLKNMEKMYCIYRRLFAEYPNRSMLVKMEDCLMDATIMTRLMFVFLDIPITHDEAIEISDFPSRMRNKFKKKRYKTIDVGQMELWKRWAFIYNGWFTNNKGFFITDTFKKAEKYIKEFGYEGV